MTSCPVYEDVTDACLRDLYSAGGMIEIEASGKRVLQQVATVRLPYFLTALELQQLEEDPETYFLGGGEHG